MLNYDAQNDGHHSHDGVVPRNGGRGFVPTADDPLCACGWPKHHHHAGVGPLADHRIGESRGNCRAFKAAIDSSNASIAQPAPDAGKLATVVADMVRQS